MKKLVLQLEEEEEEENEVMPGFRFHPTEEELVEFYLRRKVEGKRFNVELIAFLDLYRYDPWELPALAAAIGDEKEWYFYVPRDKKYRNGDRPNRVTTSGYWKATGADRIIRPENSSSSSSTSIGLKKTLVFYSGKAPKGIRTTWIMNEYRLPHHPLQKAEISLCRVYKRGGGGASAASPSPSSSSTPCSVFGINDDLQKIINNNYHQNQMQCNPNTDVVVFASSNAMQPPHQQPSLPYSQDQNEEDRLWAWNSISKDYNHIFN